jgi:hypothetical protein
MNSDAISYIDEDTLKKLKEYEKVNPVVNRLEDIEKMLNKCSIFIEAVQEHFNMKNYITQSQLFVIENMVSHIDGMKAADALEIKPEIKNESGAVTESDKALIKRCLARNPTSSFIISVADFYNKNGRISDKQRAALIKNYDKGLVNGNQVKPIDTESVEYKDTQAFLVKCEEAYPISEFVKSVKEQFIRNGKITDKQRAALAKTLKEAEDKELQLRAAAAATVVEVKTVDEVEE